jgi:GNAT superfamily N-acetyltransferase
MPSRKSDKPVLEFHPVTIDRWRDLVQLFEHHGNPGYCWCMRWRARSAEFLPLKTQGRKNALKQMVRTGTPIGILGYLDGAPVGWCSIAPRETCTHLEHSTTLKRVDDLPIWSVVCFFVNRKMRGQHFALDLLRAAVEYARSQGAAVIEGYPVEPRKNASGQLQPAIYNFMGYVSTFRQAGFRDITPPGRDRRVMRYVASIGKRKVRKPSGNRREKNR